jgi:hypothetical protein
MRTTITFDDDVAAAVEQRKRERSVGISEVVNELIRNGLAANSTARRPFTQTTASLGLQIDVTDIADALELLEGPDHR